MNQHHINRTVVEALDLPDFGKWQATLDCGHEYILDNTVTPMAMVSRLACRHCEEEWPGGEGPPDYDHAEPLAHLGRVSAGRKKPNRNMLAAAWRWARRWWRGRTGSDNINSLHEGEAQ